jgi:hypothetical protein
MTYFVPFGMTSPQTSQMRTPPLIIHEQYQNTKIDRYIIKINPAVSHADLMKKLDEMKDFDPEEMKKLHYLKVKVEAVREAGDLKKLTDLLKLLSSTT